MKNYKLAITSALIAATLFIVPLSGFAKTKLNNNIADLPGINGITAPTVLNVGQVGTWKVNAYDPNNGSLTYAVDWGDVQSNARAKSLPEEIFVQSATFMHAYSRPGTYTVTFMVKNDADKTTKSTVTVHIVGSAVSAPVITDLLATSTKKHEATVTWRTDVKSTSLLWISTSSPVDTSGSPAEKRNSKVTDHKVKLYDLKAGTTYYVVVGSMNAGGTTMSSTTSFTTLADVNKNAPIINSLEGSTTVAAGDLETVTLNASDPHNGSLTYSVDLGDTSPHAAKSLLKMSQVFVQTSTFTHVYANAGTYTATFTVQNDAGLSASQTLVITVTPAVVTDTTPPDITDVLATSSGTSTAVVTWTTDEPATSMIFYSLLSPVDPGASTTESVSDGSLVSNHSLTLTGLATSTVYNFFVESADASANMATSSPMNFTTESGM